jgi:maltose O-acetyltransferase
MISKLIIKLIDRIRGESNINKLIKAGLKISRNCHFGSGVIIDQSHCWLIEIGNNVTLAPRVHILTHDASTKRHLGYTRIGKVKIDDNVFIGAGSIVLPNVHIGTNSIIGAGSVVSRDIPSNVVAAGNPAKKLFSLDEYLRRHKERMEQMPCFGEEFTVRKKITKKMKDEMNKEMKNGQGYVV